MNKTSARDIVLANEDLSKQILDYWKKINLINRTTLGLVSKAFYKEFKNEVSEKFQDFLVQYCDLKVLTNPRWACYAYNCVGTDQKYLSHYKVEVAKDIPWKYSFAVIILTMAANLAFRKMDYTTMLKPVIVISIYFFCVQLITLLALYGVNRCTNVKNLFRNMSIAMILINFMINIISSL